MTKNSGVDVLFVHPGNRATIYQSLGENLSGIEPPVWAAMMATFVRNHGFSVDILDPETEGLGPSETASRITEINPLLSAIVVYGHQPSASTQNMTFAGQVCTEVRKISPEHNTLLVGGHVAALPERTLREEDASFVAGGEGLYTVLDLIKALKHGRSEDIQKVRGLLYREGSEIHVNPPEPLVANLDQNVGALAWDLLPMEKYRAHNWHCFGDLERQPYAAIYTTLGCPYRCTFCCIQAPFKSGEKELGYKQIVNSYRFWSPTVVVEQIDLLVNKYGIRNLRISDEMFVLNKRHVEGICDLIIERGYDLNIWAYARIDTVSSQEQIDKLKKAGFNWLCFGIEAASERVRTDVQKGVSQDMIYKTIKDVRDAGINVIANYIFGLPEDDLDTMQETLDMSLALNCEFANFYSAMAYPGSQLYNLAIKEDWPLPEKWSGYSQHGIDTLPLPTNYLSGPEVLNFRDRAWQAYFDDSNYLDMIKGKFGPETVAHIKEMASHKLDRANA